jgi:hypothetical protein
MLHSRGDPKSSFTFDDLNKYGRRHVKDSCISLFQNCPTHILVREAITFVREAFLPVWGGITRHHGPLSDRDVRRPLMSFDRRYTQPILDHSPNYLGVAKMGRGVSSRLRARLKLFHPLFSRRSTVQILFHIVNQAKKLDFSNAQAFRTILLNLVSVVPKNRASPY